MTGPGLAVLGWSAVTAAGIGADAVRDRIAHARAGGRVLAAAGPRFADYDQPLPPRPGHALAPFDVRAELGRKGTSSYDRTTALAVVCGRDALASAGFADLDAAARTRVGVSLGTTVGSFRSTSDFSRETLVQEKPYLVNPMLFPNTVMNGAAGQLAIRFGLRGVNATVAGGALGFLNAARYAANVIERGYADVVLTGAVEEFSAHRAWAQERTDRGGPGAGAGEAAGFFVLAGPVAPATATAGDGPRLRAVATGYGPGGGERAAEALAGCVRRALDRAGTAAADVDVVATGESHHADRGEYGPVCGVLGHEPERLLVAPLFGRCDAAAGAVAMAALLAGAGDGRRTALLTARGPDGAVGAAVVEV